MIEALVVLAIGGMALAVVFSIGRSASDNGFRLGRGALTAADNEISVADARVAIGSLLVRPLREVRDPARDAITGTGTAVEGAAVMRRATACAPRGWQGQLKLSIEPVAGRPTLMCRAGTRSVRLMLLGQGAAFSYSTDGAVWTPAWSNAPGPGNSGTTVVPLESASIYLRLSNPGGPEIVERLSSGFPSSWVGPSDAI